jgi:ribosomal-protein-alanine N-acetyltransferase
MLRPLLPDDVTATYVSWLNDPAITAFLETRFIAQNEATVRAFVAAQTADPDSLLFRMALIEDDIHIGNIKLGPINRHHASAQISLFIGDRKWHGKGLAIEAISAVTRWAFDTCGLKRIEAGCYSENFASLQAFLKAGFTIEGFRRSSHMTVDGRRCGSYWFARLADDAAAECK